MADWLDGLDFGHGPVARTPVEMTTLTFAAGLTQVSQVSQAYNPARRLAQAATPQPHR